MYAGGDKWWPATILLFGPRWLLAVPLLLLVPLAAAYNKRLLLPLVLAGVVVGGPIMRFNMPLSKVHGPGFPDAKTFRVLTCNIDGAHFDTKRLVALLEDMSVDIVALQECPEELKLSLPAGWHMITERGLAIISRFPLRKEKSVQITPPQSQWPGTYLLHATVTAPGGDVAFCSLQLPTPRVGLMQLLDRYTFFRPSRSGLFYQETAFRRSAALEVRRSIEKIALPVIVAGDFNTPVDSTLYRLVWHGYTNAFSEGGFGYGWTQRVFVRGYSYSARIDHILTGKGVTPLLSEVGPDIGSDHLPLIADIARTTPHKP